MYTVWWRSHQTELDITAYGEFIEINYICMDELFDGPLKAYIQEWQPIVNIVVHMYQYIMSLVYYAMLSHMSKLYFIFIHFV